MFCSSDRCSGVIAHLGVRAEEIATRMEWTRGKFKIRTNISSDEVCDAPRGPLAVHLDPSAASSNVRSASATSFYW